MADFKVGDVVSCPNEGNRYHYVVKEIDRTYGLRIAAAFTGELSRHKTGEEIGWYPQTMFVLVQPKAISSKEDMEALYG
jgi:hypothetical protein